MKKRVNGAWVDCYYGYYNEGAVDNILANTTLTITDPTPTVTASGVGRVTVTATRGVPEDSGLTIKETGFIYVKDASNTDALTLENANDASCVVTKILAGTTNGSKTAHFKDPEGKGVRVVAFAVVTDGTYKITIYTEEVKATYQELKDEQEQGIVVSHLYPGPANVLFTPKVEKVRVNGEWV